MNLSAEHDASEEGEKKAFKHAKQCQDKDQWPWHYGITAYRRKGPVMGRPLGEYYSGPL